MIRYPGHEIAVWTLLYASSAVYLCYLKVMAGQTGLALLFGMLLTGCVAIWFDIRSGKWLVVGYLAFALFGFVVLATKQAVTVSSAFRAAIAAYCTFRFACWNGPDEES